MRDLPSDSAAGPSSGPPTEVIEAAKVLLNQGEVTGPNSFPERSDDGLFGPDSVAWKLFLDPSAQIGMVGAVMLQALNPAMMRLFDQASANGRDPEGRAQRTGQYVLTTIFADSDHARAAGAAVSTMHSHARWTDPTTGEELRADTPAWLEWTHNAIVWGVLRAADLYGPSISRADQDRLVVEMHAGADLVGLDPATMASNRADLETYIEEQSAWMALTLPAAESSEGLRHPKLMGNPLETVPAAVVQAGIATMLPEWAQCLYGYREGRIRRTVARHAMAAMLAAGRQATPIDQRLRSTLADVDAHPYRKTRSERHASLEAKVRAAAGQESA